MGLQHIFQSYSQQSIFWYSKRSPAELTVISLPIMLYFISDRQILALSFEKLVFLYFCFRNVTHCLTYHELGFCHVIYLDQSTSRVDVKPPDNLCISQLVWEKTCPLNLIHVWWVTFWKQKINFICALYVVRTVAANVRQQELLHVLLACKYKFKSSTFEIKWLLDMKFSLGLCIERLFLLKRYKLLYNNTVKLLGVSPDIGFEVCSR